MADLRISELPTLAGGDLTAGDYLPLADVSASESKKITATDFVSTAITLLADATIPGSKIVFNAGTLNGSALINASVSGAKLADDAVTALKLADESSVDLVTTLPASGAFVGQIALDTDDSKIYCWNGSTWVSIKAAGSINAAVGSTAGVINVTVTQTGDSISIGTTLDNTGAASQFLAGPTSGAGAVTYRTIEGTDLPTATTTAKGGVVVNGNGLTLSGSTIVINNSVTAEATDYHLVHYNEYGLVTDGRTIIAGDVPVATAGTTGAVRPGTGLAVDGVGTINHSNVVVGNTGTKITYDNQGHVTASTTLASTDIPNLDASVITTGQFATERLTNSSVTGAKLANSSVTQIGGAGSTTGVVVFPAPEYTGQFFFDSLNGDLYLWDGNAYQPITITAGEIVFAGTYSAATNEVATTTSAGAAVGLTVGAALPAADTTNNRYYLIVADSGTGTAPAPAVSLQAPDMILSDGSAWTLIDVSNTVTAQQASNISITAISGVTGSNVQAALEDLQLDKVEKSGGTFTGNVTLDAVSLVFDTGSFNTTVSAATASAARTITFPNQTGNVLVSGNASIVNADISVSAAIAYSKLASLTSSNIIVGNSSNVATGVAVTGDVTISNTGVTSIASGAIVNADINASAAIAFSKFASLNSGNVLVGNSSNVATSVAMSGDVTISNTGVATVISGSTSTAGKLQLTDSTSSTSTTTAATPNSVKSAYDLANAALPKAGGTITGNLEIGTTGSLTFEGSIADGFETTFAVTNPTADRTITFPDATTTVVGTDVTQTLTNKTLTDPAIIGTILEDVYTITDGAAFEVDPGNGSVQLITLGANRTPKATNFAAGESVTLMIADGTAYTITWTDATWGSGGVTWVGGSAPTLATSGYTVIQLWKVSTKVYGARVGDVA